MKIFVFWLQNFTFDVIYERYPSGAIFHNRHAFIFMSQTSKIFPTFQRENNFLPQTFTIKSCRPFISINLCVVFTRNKFCLLVLLLLFLSIVLIDLFLKSNSILFKWRGNKLHSWGAITNDEMLDFGKLLMRRRSLWSLPEFPPFIFPFWGGWF